MAPKTRKPNPRLEAAKKARAKLIKGGHPGQVGSFERDYLAPAQAQAAADETEQEPGQ